VTGRPRGWRHWLTLARTPRGTADPGPSSVHRGTTRLEAFSDGVFAITTTLLILEIKPPTDYTHLLHGLAIWLWHVPVLFDAAVDQVALHRLQHLSFFGTAVLFWWAVLWRSEAGAAAWHVVVTMLHTSVLGALMALAPRVLYVAQTATAAAWGLTPLEDQQLAGLIMWVPAGTIYAGTALALIALWIRNSGRKARQAHALNAV